MVNIAVRPPCSRGNSPQCTLEENRIVVNDTVVSGYNMEAARACEVGTALTQNTMGS